MSDHLKSNWQGKKKAGARPITLKNLADHPVLRTMMIILGGSGHDHAIDFGISQSQSTGADFVANLLS